MTLVKAKNRGDRRRLEDREARRERRQVQRDVAEDERNHLALNQVLLYQHLQALAVLRENQIIQQMIEDEEWSLLVEEEEIRLEGQRIDREFDSLEPIRRALLTAVQDGVPQDQIDSLKRTADDLLARSAGLMDDVLALIGRRLDFRERE